MVPVSQEALKKMLDELNPSQRQAAETIYGPVLVLAGAGSGKTKSLTYRIANMVAQGIPASKMFVATFTNKAAGEMKERIAKVVGEEETKKIWAGTFHSLCVRMLRRHAHKIGYANDFSIYDPSDCLDIIKRVYKILNIKDDYKEGLALHYIDQAKNNLWTPEYCLYNVADTPTYEVMAQVYAEYQSIMKEQNGMDFGDLIMNVVLLLEQDEEARAYWCDKFHFIMSDEYQDVNKAQFKLLQFLAWPQNNIFVVGDDKQSIYGFRGSDISHILTFEKTYFPCTTIYLSQNYRSSDIIVAAGNAIMKYNKGQKEMDLFTEKKGGNKIKVLTFENEYMEAAYIAGKIKNIVMNEESGTFDRFAILYRNNSLSRILEDVFRPNFIPYKVIGGVSFYQREEVKDTLAYLRVIHNLKDDPALARIMNKPTRGIGKTSQDAIVNFANEKRVSIYRALRNAEDIPTIKKASLKKIQEFLDLVAHLQEKQTHDIAKFARYVLDQTGYIKMWRDKKTQEAQEKLDNVDELLRLIAKYQEDNPEKTLADFLQETSLLTDIDQEAKANESSVKMMSIHASKGLEFDTVFVIGCSEGIFPSWRSQEPSELEEERRLAYVAITRAEKELYLSHSEMRNVGRGNQSMQPSRFLEELPDELLQKVTLKK